MAVFRKGLSVKKLKMDHSLTKLSRVMQGLGFFVWNMIYTL